jgi:hypothetical protein
MWRINYQTLIMAVSDQIRNKPKPPTPGPDDPAAPSAPKEGPVADNSALEFFQSMAQQ